MKAFFRREDTPKAPKHVSPDPDLCNEKPCSFLSVLGVNSPSPANVGEGAEPGFPPQKLRILPAVECNSPTLCDEVSGLRGVPVSDVAAGGGDGEEGGCALETDSERIHLEIESAASTADHHTATNKSGGSDVGTYVGKPITDYTNYQLLKNPWRPPPTYQLPYSIHMGKGRETKRYLGHNQLNNYSSWLMYSPSIKGGFCKFCPWFVVGGVAGGRGGENNMRLQTLVTNKEMYFDVTRGFPPFWH